MFGVDLDDAKIVEEIHSYGLSVKQAYKMKKDGSIPQELANSIEDYQSRLGLKCGGKYFEN